MRRAALLLSVLALPQGGFACDIGRLGFTGTEMVFDIAVADTVEERSKGLMDVARMDLEQAMLFVYQAPGHPHFWMKDTLIPLDMIFMGPDGRISRIHHRAKPLDETPIDGGAGVQYVLEINGGLAADLGLEPGDAMIWPGLGAAAAAPCR